MLGNQWIVSKHCQKKHLSNCNKRQKNAYKRVDWRSNNNNTRKKNANTYNVDIGTVSNKSNVDKSLPYTKKKLNTYFNGVSANVYLCIDLWAALTGNALAMFWFAFSFRARVSECKCERGCMCMCNRKEMPSWSNVVLSKEHWIEKKQIINCRGAHCRTRRTTITDCREYNPTCGGKKRDKRYRVCVQCSLW